MKLTDADRRALEWVRDGDERCARVDHAAADALVRRGLVMPVRPGLVGLPGLTNYVLTARGRAALGDGAPS
jgi:hypothetical protein